MATKSAKIKSYKYGVWAEYFVVIYLFFKGYHVLKIRYKTKVGEVDIIARRGSMLVFIEVKARHLAVNEVLGTKQQKRITNAATIFIAKNTKFANFDMRFDLVIVKRWRVPVHLKNAWGEGWW